jgi:hypothetical protein
MIGRTYPLMNIKEKTRIEYNCKPNNGVKNKNMYEDIYETQIHDNKRRKRFWIMKRPK